jgi:hypothetical protein
MRVHKVVCCNSNGHFGFFLLTVSQRSVRRCVMRTVCGYVERTKMRHGLFRIRDRGTRLFHLQLPRSGFFAFPMPWPLNTDGSLPGGGGGAGGRRTACARIGARYPVTGVPFRVVRALIRSVSSLVLVCFWSATQTRSRRALAHLGVSCRGQCHGYVVTLGGQAPTEERTRERTSERCVLARFLSRWRRRFSETPSRDLNF